MNIRSMTGYGTAQSSNDLGSVTIELRSVNSRYLDLQFRMPDELRMAEMPLRELIAKSVTRGKIDVRASYSRAQKDITARLSASLLTQAQSAYAHVKSQFSDVQAPTFADVLQWTDADKTSADPMQWVPACVDAAKNALNELLQTREREGTRLLEIISAQSEQAAQIVATLKADLPNLMQLQAQRISTRLREAFEQACPEGLDHIKPEEISARLAAEASLFSLRADVAEELDRLSLHLAELNETLAGNGASAKKAPSKGVGKRLDFLFQEMNREANTLGSKAVDMRLTRASIDLKLLIEQMREQIQNIE